MSQILPNLWLGSFADATHAGFLERKKITHILNCAEDCPVEKYPYQITVQKVPMTDGDDADWLSERYLITASSFLDLWLKEGATVMVHCLAGISRSAAVVMAWLIRYNGLPFDTAYELVSKARPIVRPNDQFVAILRRFGTR